MRYSWNARFVLFERPLDVGHLPGVQLDIGLDASLARYALVRLVSRASISSLWLTSGLSLTVIVVLFAMPEAPLILRSTL
jgi:hypothetical protein